MCTTIMSTVAVSGSGKGPHGWQVLDRVNLAYDHPFHASVEHAVLIDCVRDADGARVALELDRESARRLALGILATVDQGDAYEAGTGAVDSVTS
jgi:hypothetical protein